ncbi:MAG TPA: cobalamin-independent methionine synthase II family protein [Rhizomicrobium sp.]|nr:cobalamin-independent methionine synthase II family protein [Rhizomicrobium sp.]
METGIRTTHVGSLPRPPSLLSRMQRHDKGWRADDDKNSPEFAKELAESVKQIVARQVKLGIDLVSDGELSKPSYATYVSDRLTGFSGEWKGSVAADLKAFPEFAQHLVETGAVVPRGGGSCCRGPVSPKDNEALSIDLANMRAAVDASRPVGAFLNAASPGVVAVFQANEYYPDDDAYIEAVAEALRPEYEAIVDAGFDLQIDSPDLAMSRHLVYANLDEPAFLRIIERNVAALNHATRNISSERLRMHICWGNYAGSHHLDIPFERIVSRVMVAKPQMLLIEGANSRHGHEWAVFEEFSLPEDKILAPGVIDSVSNTVEHPELVAQRLLNYSNVVGRDRVVGGSDCGFSTFSGFPTVYPDIVWLKLASLVEGAKIASSKLWPRRKAG